jgi:hypothetical protein
VAAHLTLATATDLWTPHPNAAAMAAPKKRPPRAHSAISSDAPVEQNRTAPSRHEMTVKLVPGAAAAANKRADSPGVQF